MCNVERERECEGICGYCGFISIKIYIEYIEHSKCSNSEYKINDYINNIHA